jgi:hypothetical protein
MDPLVNAVRTDLTSEGHKVTPWKLVPGMVVDHSDGAVLNRLLTERSPPYLPELFPSRLSPEKRRYLLLPQAA